MVFYWSLSDNKFFHFSRSLLGILVDLNCLDGPNLSTDFQLFQSSFQAFGCRFGINFFFKQLNNYIVTICKNIMSSSNSS